MVKLDTAGAITWATFFGDSSAIQNQRIAVDPSDNAYILDGVAPTTAGALEPNPGLNQQGYAPPFLVKIAPSLGAAVMVVSSKAVSFGNQLVGTPSASSDISVGNFGDANLATTVSITGDFSQTNTCTTSVPGGQKCDINVVFNPTVVGTLMAKVNVQAGTLEVSINDPSPEPSAFVLAGIGLVAAAIKRRGRTMSVTA